MPKRMNEIWTEWMPKYLANNQKYNETKKTVSQVRIMVQK